MVKELTRLVWILAIASALMLLAFGQNLHAHQLDEYLQSTLVSIDPNEVHLSIHLTPGVAIADKVLAQLDSDRDGIISTNEANAYVEQFKRDLTITLDQDPVGLKLTELNLPELSELTNGFGMIELEFGIVTSLRSGPHTFTIENHHFPEISAYLVNAAAPKSPTIQITAQRRNETQSTATIAFRYELPTHFSKLMTFAILSVLYCAMFAGVWRLQTRQQRSS